MVKFVSQVGGFFHIQNCFIVFPKMGYPSHPLSLIIMNHPFLIMFIGFSILNHPAFELALCLSGAPGG